ncbi:MAG: sodium-dependent transporter [Planctomycetota bacterium]
MAEAETHWSNRTEFIMAAVGSAIGLGNIWRFPYVCYKNGGGAFLIPFIVALFAAGIPLLIMKFAVGQSSRFGAPKALGGLNRNWTWLGWMAVLVGFFIAAYYAVVMGWSFNYLYYSFAGMPWGVDVEQIERFFMKDVLDFIPLGEVGAGAVVWPVFIGLILTWVAIYFSIFKGVKTVGKVVWITVPLPALILVILIIRGITLPGSAKGLETFLTPDFAALADPSVWLAAVGQVFYSLSLGFGIMIAYSAHNPRVSDINNSAFMTGIWDSLFAFLCGFAVFSVLGFLAHALNSEVSDVAKAGPGLAFVIFPTILAKLPALNQLFSVLFFIMLLTLGIDSAFSLVEAIAKAVKDFTTKMRVEVLALIVCLVLFVFGIPFALRSGLMTLDIVDHYMNIGLVIVCFLECILIGWISGTENLRSYANEVSDFRIGKWWDVCIKWVIPFSLAILLIANIYDDIVKPYEGYERHWLIAFGWVPLFLTFFVGLVLGRHYRIIGVVTGIAVLCFLAFWLIPLSAQSTLSIVLSIILFGGMICFTTLAALRAGKKKVPDQEQ